MGKVVYATKDVVLHESHRELTNVYGDKAYDVTSHVVRSGETFPFDKLAPYQQEALKAGEVEGVEVLSEEEAQKKQAAYAEAVALVSGTVNIRQTDTTLAGPDADDGSHSDFLVPDEERAQNQANEADAEPDAAPAKKETTKTEKE